MDDDDEERSRSIPARTRIGKRASIIEKFPALGQSLILFAGLITVPFWGYRQLSIAMLDVMMADLPRVDYHNGEEAFTDEEQREAYRKSQDAMKKVQEGGLKSIKGLNLNLNNQKSVQSLLNRAKN